MPSDAATSFDHSHQRACALAARGLLLALIVAGAVGLMAHAPQPIGGAALQQADGRSLGPLPNAVNVLSHLPLLVVALLGWRACRGAGAWRLFMSVVAVGAAAGALFHAEPTPARQLATEAAVASACALVSLLFLAERLDAALLERRWPWLAALAGPAAALAAATTDDMRWLIALHGLPLLLIPLGIWRLPSRGMPGRDWLVACAIYVAANFVAWADGPLWQLSAGTLGGWAPSHLLLALCVAWLGRCAMAPLQAPTTLDSTGASANQPSTSLTTSA